MVQVYETQGVKTQACQTQAYQTQAYKTQAHEVAASKIAAHDDHTSDDQSCAGQDLAVAGYAVPSSGNAEVNVNATQAIVCGCFAAFVLVGMLGWPSQVFAAPPAASPQTKPAPDRCLAFANTTGQPRQAQHKGLRQRAAFVARNPQNQTPVVTIAHRGAFATPNTTPNGAAQTKAFGKTFANGIGAFAPMGGQSRALKQLQYAKLQANQVKVQYVGHATFLLTTPKGVTVATDYNDYVSLPKPPDVATMNFAHETHHSANPDPRIKHVLRGWFEGAVGQKANVIDLTVEDLRIRNVPTNIRSGGVQTVRNGNSIFIFEVAGLCIAHLGHLHHTLTNGHLAQIGQMDVVLVPVDGSYTLDLPGTMTVLKALKAPLIIPMHFFSEYSLLRFLEEASKTFVVSRKPVTEMVISRDQLPAKPTIAVMEAKPL